MDIRNNLDGLKTLLGGTPAVPAATPQTRSGATTSAGLLGSDHATLSEAGNEVSLTAAASGVRADKVAAVQSALAAGSYQVPASAVASKLVDVMLGGEGSF
jgi:flagellar biosynthesis anti-sigma factor FlgM